VADAEDGQGKGGSSEDAPHRRMHLEKTYESAATTVFRTAAWIPPAYRQAYLEGAAAVLGHEPLPDGP
jgi:hypothetical protein